MDAGSALIGSISEYGHRLMDLAFMILCNSSQVCILIWSTRSGHSADMGRLYRCFKPHGSFLSHLFHWFPFPRTTFCITNSPQHLVVASDSSDSLSRLCFMLRMTFLACADSSALLSLEEICHISISITAEMLFLN